jgi:hypothetical protein
MSDYLQHWDIVIDYSGNTNVKPIKPEFMAVYPYKVATPSGCSPSPWPFEEVLVRTFMLHAHPDGQSSEAVRDCVTAHHPNKGSIELESGLNYSCWTCQYDNSEFLMVTVVHGGLDVWLTPEKDNLECQIRLRLFVKEEQIRFEEGGYTICDGIYESDGSEERGELHGSEVYHSPWKYTESENSGVAVTG